MLNFLFTVGGAGLIIYTIFKLFSSLQALKSNVTEDDDNDVSFNSISNKLDELQRTKNRLKEIEELITDLSALDDGGQLYTIEWEDLNTNTRHSYDFLLIDNKSKEHLLALAKLERKYLRTSLTSDVEKLRLYVTKRNENDDN